MFKMMIDDEGYFSLHYKVWYEVSHFSTIGVFVCMFMRSLTASDCYISYEQVV